MVDFIMMTKHLNDQAKPRHFKDTILETSIAIRFLEESLNLGFCRFDTMIFSSYEFNYDTILIDIINDSITSTDLAIAFNKIAGFAANIYNLKDLTTRQSVFFGLKYGFDPVSNNKLPVEVCYTVAFNLESAYKSGFYDNDDYWYYCCNRGKCGNYSGEEPLDGAQILRKDLRHDLIPKRLLYQYYFVEPMNYCFHKGSDCYDIEMPIHYNQYIFVEEDRLFFKQDDCMTPNDMNYYYSEMKNLAIENKPTNMQIVYLDVISDQTLSNPPSYVHGLRVTYAKLIDLIIEIPLLNLIDYLP